MSIFADSLRSAFTAIKDIAGEKVVYSYDGVEIKITAVPATVTSPEDVTGGRTRVSNRTLNWLIDASLLAIDGVLIKPKRGNTIIREDGRTYKVAAPNQGACWNWSDGSEVYLEVQTVEFVKVV